MTIEQTDKIDFVTHTRDGEILLSISDYLPWDQEGQHLLLLQDKLNAYLRFIEGGELEEHYPQSVGLPIVLNLVMKFGPSRQGSIFLSTAADAIAAAGFELRFEVVRPN